MKGIVIAGMSIVNLALISYSVAIISEQKNRVVNNFNLTFLTFGVILDIAATICMIAGSTHTAFSSHGIFGYSALLGMLIDCILFWKYRILSRQINKVGKVMHLYSRFAYIWWLIAYFTGIVIVMIRHNS